MVGQSRGNKQVDKNAAKEKSTDSKRSKKMVKAGRNLGGGQAREGAEDNKPSHSRMYAYFGI